MKVGALCIKKEGAHFDTPSLILFILKTRILGKNIVALIPFTLRYRKQIISVVSKIGTFRCIIFGCISTHNGSETFLSHQVIPSPSFHCQFTTTFLPDDFFQTLLVGFCYVGQCISCCSRDIRLLISSRIYRISFAGSFSYIIQVRKCKPWFSVFV